MLQNLTHKKVHYVLYTPPKPTGNLLVFFHGAGEGGYSDGTQLNKVLKNNFLALAQQGKDFPFMILAPQGVKDLGMTLPSFNEVRKVLGEIIDGLKPTKTVFSGLSLGAQEVLGYYTNATYTSNGALVNPFISYAKADGFISICGRNPGTPDWNIVDKPLLLIHGDSDDAVPITSSEKVVREVARTNKVNKPVLMTIPGGEHNTAWEYAFGLNTAAPAEKYYTAVMTFLKSIFKDEPLPVPEDVYPKKVIGITIINATSAEFTAEDGSRYVMTVSKVAE